jgi:hypothetical protein
VHLQGVCYEDSVSALQLNLFYNGVINAGVRMYLARLDRKVERYMLLAGELESVSDAYKPMSF